MSVFALSGLINGLIALGLGIFIIWHNWRSKLNQLYFLIVVAISIWSFSYWQWLSSNNSTSALFWVRLLSIGSTLIPAFYFHWIVSLLGLEKQEKRAVRLVYFTVSLFLLFSFSNLFIKGVSKKLFFSYWPEPGVLYHFYLIFAYIILVIYSLSLLLKRYRISSEEKKAQIIYVIIGSIIAFGGGLTNFFLWYDIPILPYGNFFVALYPFLFGYALLKHDLFSIRIIATELFTFTVWIILLLRFLLSETLQEFSINIGLFIAVIAFGILLIRSVRKEVLQREKLEVLTKEIKEAYEVEKKAREKLKELDEAKNQFIMATQHHLRTPLTSMAGYLDLIFGGTYGKVSPRIKETLRKFQASTNRLIKVVNEFLDISQFQLGKRVISLQPDISIKSIFEEIVDELQLEAKARGIYLKFQGRGKMPKIKADPGKLKLALYNVVDNGIKYTNKGGVAIKLETKGSKLRIIVKDTGAGISKEDQKTLFAKLFERGKEAKKLHGTGRGIGLYIAFHIIKAHKGKIWAESEGRNKGSVFYVELPIK